MLAEPFIRRLEIAANAARMPKLAPSYDAQFELSRGLYVGHLIADAAQHGAPARDTTGRARDAASNRD
jgi:hypothetical protein